MSSSYIGFPFSSNTGKPFSPRTNVLPIMNSESVRLFSLLLNKFKKLFAVCPPKNFILSHIVTSSLSLPKALAASPLSNADLKFLTQLLFIILLATEGFFLSK